MTDGSGKLAWMTGPAFERLDSGAAIEGVDKKRSSAAALKRKLESIISETRLL